MGNKNNRILLGKLLPLLLVLILGGLSMFGCVNANAEPKGWSGGTIAEDTLLIGSMEGEIVAINTTDGSRLWGVPLQSSEPETFSFGCATPSAKVAIYGSPAVGDDLVYIGGYNGKIYAISLSKGAMRWVYPREDNLEPFVGGVAVSQDKVFIGSSDGKVYALDASTGDKEWEFQTGGKIWVTPAISGNTLYIGSFDKKLYALSTDDGSIKWEFKTEGAIAATPLVYNNTVYIGSFDRYFYAIDATSGNLRWKSMGESWFWAKAIAQNNAIYAPCLDGKIYVFDIENGAKVVDAIGVEGPVSSSPVLVDSTIIIASEEGKIYSLNSSNNQIKQLTQLEEKIRSPLSSSGKEVYIHTEKDDLYAMDAQTGAMRELFINY
ncbi:PQQ-binding-like beta-propeller repeat protein [Chloroflexota bacterium]